MGARVCFLILESISVFFLLAAFFLTLAALSSSEWQVVNLRQMGQILHEGLWEDCVFGSRGSADEGKNWLCTLKIFEQNSRINGNQQKFGATQQNAEEWRLVVLIFLSIATFFGLMAFIFASVGICLDACRIEKFNGISKILALLLTTLAALLSVAGIILFARKAQDLENRVVTEISESELKTLGTSFYLGAAGCVIYVIATLLSLACVILGRLMPMSSEGGRSPRTWQRMDGGTKI